MPNKPELKAFLDSSIILFTYYKELGERAMDQLDEASIFYKANEESNSIAILVKHMWGNMMSRWTDIFESDGEKEWRNREMEFIWDEPEEIQRVDQYWQKGWTCLLDALHGIQEADYGKLIYIRGKGHTIIEAVQRQLGHYGYHIGQIVLMGKSLKKEEWTSLSIPKGDSAKYNKESFSKGKRKEHFSEHFKNQDPTTRK